MTTTTPARRNARRRALFCHPSFTAPDAEALYTTPLDTEGPAAALGHLSEELVQNCARRQHYASWRVATATTPADRQHWEQLRVGWRNRIVVGSRGLAFRLVNRWRAHLDRADLDSEAKLALLRAAENYNPWLGRASFSTYATRCVYRGLLNATRRVDRSVRCRRLPSYELPDDTPPAVSQLPDNWPLVAPLLRDGHPLLTTRERQVLRRLFGLDGGSATTARQVSDELGLSHQRIQQLRDRALVKIRRALGLAEGTHGVSALPS